MLKDLKSLSSFVSESIDKFGNNKEQMQSVGYVISVGDGVVKIYGLENVCIGSFLISKEKDVKALILSLSSNFVEALIMSNASKVKEGDIFHIEKESIQVKCGMPLLGRVVDPLSNPIDDKGVIVSDEYIDIERSAPSVMDRKSVSTPLMTGIKAIDCLIPIGRGQRELIIGDRDIGKTTIAIDTIINQAKLNKKLPEKDRVYCIYVAIGQKKFSVAEIYNTLQNAGAMDYCTIVCASASDSAAMQYIAPYSGSAMAEYFRDNGMHSLIIYDDLSKHAVAYRQISLLLKRPPGREAYPGDIFYLHSRLLERSAQMSDSMGGGSMTALPIIETQAGDVSAYIPTNVISITDGQIFLKSDLFYYDHKPAIDVGLSVSRVGSSAQFRCIKNVSGKLKLDISQYRELKSFTQFGSSDLDDVSLKILKKGSVCFDLLKQKNGKTYSASEQSVLFYVADKVSDFWELKEKEVEKFESMYLETMHMDFSSIMKKIELNKDIDDDSKDVCIKCAKKITQSIIGARPS